MNKAKEEALKMLKNNNAAKAAEILKKKSIETNAPSKNKSNFLEALDIRPLFSADAEKEAPPVAKLVAAILSLICGAAAAYLICGLVYESTTAFISASLDSAFLFGFLFVFIWIFVCVGFGLDLLKSTSMPYCTLPNNNFLKSSFDTEGLKDSFKRLNGDWEIRRYSPSYSGCLGNIHYRS